MTIEPSDADLLSAWAAGERSAGAALVERYFALVYRFFRNKVGTELEDLVQQTFLGCTEARTRYQGHANFKTFLLAIARNQLFLHYRKQHRAALDLELTPLQDLKTSPSGVVARHQERKLVAEGLRRVPLAAQVVLELLYWEGLEIDEIARVLDVPLNTAYSRVHRARMALRAQLEALAPDAAGRILSDIEARTDAQKPSVRIGSPTRASLPRNATS
ncbi:MAG TPA: RNA polymerase sigma factor [Polyangiales bacterium]|nr:RNA polymerase sigma factor [Polyangiales bacterium]